MRAIPFLPEFHAKVRDGRKTATARSKPYGKPGDRLQGPGCVLVLEHVTKAPLGVVANECYGFEGLTSPQEFIDVWNRIHPRADYDRSTEVFLHRSHVEGRLPVCDLGWSLLSKAERIDANARSGGWRPILNEAAAAINRSTGCPVHGFAALHYIDRDEDTGVDAMVACIGCLHDGATPGGVWSQVVVQEA